jgi:hypothetical protein
MRTRLVCLSVVATVLVAHSTLGQSPFVNLDFESATITPTPVGGSTSPADPALAFPGWTIGGANTVVMYNELSVGAPAVSLMGPAFPNAVNYLTLQGSYSALLYYFNPLGVPSLSQTALVPSDARSISFLVDPDEANAVVSLDGAPITLVPAAGGRLAGDVSAYAGKSALLTFSTPNISGGAGQFFYFDDVQFSAATIPEPNAWALFAMGALLLWRKARDKTRDKPCADP